MMINKETLIADFTEWSKEANHISDAIAATSADLTEAEEQQLEDILDRGESLAIRALEIGGEDVDCVAIANAVYVNAQAAYAPRAIAQSARQSQPVRDIPRSVLAAISLSPRVLSALEHAA